jgi:N6-L-threonylcarbamoyladenine synthase
MYLLAIETSCDETSAAVSCDNKVLSNVISSQWEHERYGGVVPELASRIHQQRVIGVVESALKKAEVTKEMLNAVAFTQGPGLLGSLLVGVSFSKAFALSLGLPLIAVNHLDAHILANFLNEKPPEFPFLCLTVSGGHTQLVLVRDFYDMEIMGETMDDAAGEAFDKAAKMLNLPYPGGPLVDKYAKLGNPHFHAFPDANVGDLAFSFSGLKTSLLYFLKKNIAQDPDFVTKNMNDICASYQYRIVSTLLEKMEKAAKLYKVKHLAIAGGVSANSELRRRFAEMCEKNHWQAHIPAFQYCTDNAGMIAIAGYYKYLKQDFVGMNVAPFTRV